MQMTDYQQQVFAWALVCFGAKITQDKVERNYRFLEEALELAQACGTSKEDALRLVDYVYDRPVGEIEQEVGGVMVTLLALCTAQDINAESATATEIERINNNIEKIRTKQAAKKIKSGPLP